MLLCQNPSRLPESHAPRQRAYLEGQHRGVADSSIARWLDADNLVGLIALSGAREGDVGRAIVQRPRSGGAARRARAGSRCSATVTTSSCSDSAREDEERYIARRAGDGGRRPASRSSRPTTCASSRAERFRIARSARLHSRRRAARRRQARPRRYTEAAIPADRRSEMAELFADMPEALDNSVEIARRCILALKLGESRAAGLSACRRDHSIEDFIREEARAAGCDAWNRRSTAVAAGARSPRIPRAPRVASSSVICQMGFAGYFLIVADFIRWARDNGVPVGPGRGSGAGSLVAYSLGITDIDPLQVRPAVRALPESRARLDARLRHRLLHGRPRPRHRIRVAEVRPRARLADHHLRHDGGEGRGARRAAACSAWATASSTRSPS